MFDPQEEEYDNKENMFSLLYLFDYLEILVRRRRLIATTILVIPFGTLIYVLLATPMYEATVLILPEATIAPTGTSGNLGALEALVGFAPRGASLYPDILASHNFVNRILNREFESKKFDKKMKLLDILVPKGKTEEERVLDGHIVFNEMLDVEENNTKGITTITILSPEAERNSPVVLAETPLPTFLTSMRRRSFSPFCTNPSPLPSSSR